MTMTARILVLCLFSLILGVIPARADISDEQAIKAILGEARGEGWETDQNGKKFYTDQLNYEAMYAVACAIRNRGTLRGVYGATAKTEPISPELWQRASKAWFNSEDGGDITLGATHWENIGAFGKPYWAKNMAQTVKVGNHNFYRESKRTS